MVENEISVSRRKAIKTAVTGLASVGYISNASAGSSSLDEEREWAKEILTQRYNEGEARIVLNIAENYEDYVGDDAYNKASKEIVEHTDTPLITEDIQSGMPAASELAGDKKEPSTTMSHCTSQAFPIERTARELQETGATEKEYKAENGYHHEYVRASFYGSIQMRCLQQAYFGNPPADGTYRVHTWYEPKVNITAGGQYDIQIAVFDHSSQPTEYSTIVNTYTSDNQGPEQRAADFHLEEEHWYSIGILSRSTCSAAGDAGSGVETWYNGRIFDVSGNNLQVTPLAIC